MRRTLLAALLPALAIAVAWLSLEDPRLVGEGLAVAALAIVAALVRPGAIRVGVVVVAALVAAWIAFGTQPWELAPFRDEPVLAPALGDAARGIEGFYEVFLPFEPAVNPEMHSLVLCAIFGFVAAVALLVAARRPLAAAAVTVAGVGWPATLLGGTAIVAGTVALAAALAIPLDPARRVGAHGAGGRSHRRARRARSGRDVVDDDARPRRGRRLGDVGHPWAGTAGERGPVHLGLELRGHQVPVREDGRSARRRSEHAALLANDDARRLRRQPLVRAPVLARSRSITTRRRCSYLS